MSKKKKEPKIRWVTSAVIGAYVDRKPKSLALNIQNIQDEWLVIAIETPHVSSLDKPAVAIESVFANHAHKTVGSFASVKDAIDATEAYAKKWISERTDGPIEAQCECEEIEEPS